LTIHYRRDGQVVEIPSEEIVVDPPEATAADG